MKVAVEIEGMHQLGQVYKKDFQLQREKRQEKLQLLEREKTRDKASAVAEENQMQKFEMCRKEEQEGSQVLYKTSAEFTQGTSALCKEHLKKASLKLEWYSFIFFLFIQQ